MEILKKSMTKPFLLSFNAYEINDWHLINQSVYLKRHIWIFWLYLSPGGISPDPKKVTPIKNADIPKTASEGCSFLRLANFVFRFIKNYVTITEPLWQLTRSGSPFG
mgnify:CR=1 FL=1